MKLVEINWDPTDRQLRQFGIICLFALPILGGLWFGRPVVIGILALVGVALAVAPRFRPPILRPIFLALSIVAMPVGMIVGEIAMLAVYFGVFFPMGLMFRAIGRDALRLKMERGARTHWQPKAKPRSVSSYYRQF
jgi:hypothetical protein